MKDLNKILLLVLVSLGGYAQKKPNILFIAVDDLKTELGSYGSDVVLSPNIDALANDGVQFNRAYCQQAICGPSRASVMTGSRPESINVIDLFQDFRENRPSIVTIPQHFKENGYETTYVGKVFHPGYSDDEMSWTRKATYPPKDPNVPKTKGAYASKENQEIYEKNRIDLEARYGEEVIRKNWLAHGPGIEAIDVPDETYKDGYNTLAAIETFKELKKSDKPWFLGLGYLKPHLDWIAPKKYWDLYDRDQIKIASQINPPKNGASLGLSESMEVRVGASVPKTEPFTPELQRELRHGYYACISYIDAQLGKVVEALKEAGEYENTIIVLWSDHGFNLGEMGYWGKATNYEVATRVPFIIKAPGKAKQAKTDALVELVDIFPTLNELAGLENPSNVEGKSLVPLLKKPDCEWDEVAYSVFPSPALREWAARPWTPPFRTAFFAPLIKKIEARIGKQMGEKWNRKTFEKFVMGYAMRTDRYRMVVWKDRRKPKEEPLFVELYDHKKDPTESVNVADKNPKIVSKLLLQLAAK